MAFPTPAAASRQLYLREVDMNWEMIGAVGEILGAAAVIATLAYLSRQIRASTQATRRAAMQEILDQTGYFLDNLSSTSETAGVWGRGLAGDASLSPDQRVYKWQRRLNGIQRMFADGCRLDLDVRALFDTQPFASVEVDNFYMEETPRTHGYMYRGVAVK